MVDPRVTILLVDQVVCVQVIRQIGLLRLKLLEEQVDIGDVERPALIEVTEQLS